ncbi:hypothetical protein H5119_07690 [Pseudoalteromonas sp. SG45-5]|uniref:hypothetical protein n=1 Tax=unclassified Pseudoalteromonas TaxID=194690 RepID=UPI0015F7CDFB|nr:MULTISPECIES: hypothetical protein [unclassified Pseudoalteromonas]MBB1385417.1 hypothetical protein [Pseudoalteromonas sp. SG45-5]MBB1393393.1 hypothetical protein [Pseudoalteromonas sp. SG44-4]MBB1447862.1 hypothetical protein [Pseudoalteromonas sp. SG41-6]
MNSTMKKVLPALLLATAFNTASVIATEGEHTMQLEQCVIGETMLKSNTITESAIDANVTTVNNVSTDTLFSRIENKISADLDSSIDEINARVDENISKIASSITTYMTSVLLDK